MGGVPGKLLVESEISKGGKKDKGMRRITQLPIG